MHPLDQKFNHIAAFWTFLMQHRECENAPLGSRQNQRTNDQKMNEIQRTNLANVRARGAQPVEAPKRLLACVRAFDVVFRTCTRSVTNRIFERVLTAGHMLARLARGL